MSEPPANLAGFPAKKLNRDWFRAHTVGRGPWWFSHDGSGRFDLAAPAGTCYLASHSAAAVHERLGEILVAARQITSAVADQMVVSQLPLTESVADTTVQAATRHGVTRELGTITPYGVPQRWAAALYAAGYGGVRYWPRFSLSPDYRAAAIFGAAGVDPHRPIDPAPVPGRIAAAKAGIRVSGPPRRLPIKQPPA